jgi:hypothetical protein
MDKSAVCLRGGLGIPEFSLFDPLFQKRKWLKLYNKNDYIIVYMIVYMIDFLL